MNVTLINYTPEADVQLIFTKSTRLELKPGLLNEIRSWPNGRRLAELQYMADTIPSSWEFVDYTFLVEGVSRAYTHQQVRTRAASYAQQTMRVLNMGGFDYVFTDRNREDPAAMRIIEEHNAATRRAYQALIDLGQAPEDARGILPTNIATNIVCKFNLRTLTELVRARSGGRTQGEYRDVVGKIANCVLEVHPWAALFLFPAGRDAFAEIEAFAEQEFRGDLLRKGRLLKIVDHMRRAQRAPGAGK